MNFTELGLALVKIEAQAVFELIQKIDEHFDRACTELLKCPGRIVVTGMGKSGHIARKVAATFASTGSPAFFMHPAEASHGDAGMITSQDVVLMISHSGQTLELLAILPLIKRLGIPLIAMTGHADSTLAQTADIHLDVSIHQEACPLGLAPTTSTTVSLVMGDALAIALLQARGFTADDFARSHPGGSLGKKLLLKIDDLYHQGDAIPIVHEDVTVREALIEVSEKKLGMTCVVNELNQLVGVYTDGDIRRTLIEAHDINVTPLKHVMSHHYRTIKPGALAAEALALMQQHRITSLVIEDQAKQPAAVIHIHDLLRAGVI
jgi:arabinose-5-phosphate isomerase